jgi:hypothetical protein
MGKFDYMIQPQGPVIPINLYADNANAGIQGGNAMPSMTSSIINGAIKGLQTGQDMQTQDLQNQVTQHTIDRFPQADAAQDAQASNNQMINRINQLKLQKEEATQKLDIQDTTAKYENDIAKLDQEAKLREKQTAFNAAWQQAQGQDKANLVFSGQYSDLFSAVPSLYKQSLETLLNTPGVSLEQRQGVMTALGKASASDFWTKEAQKAQGKLQAASGALYDAPYMSELATKLNASPQEVPGKIEFKESGRYSSVDGKLQKDPATGDWMQDPNYDPKALTGRWDIVNPSTGDVLFAAVDKDVKKPYVEYATAKNTVDGTYAKWNMANIEAAAEVKGPPKQAPKVAGFNTPPSSAAKTEEALQKEYDPITRAIKQTLSFDDAQVEVHLPVISAVRSKLEAYQNDPKVRADPQAFKEIQMSLESLIKAKTVEDFKKNPALSEKYSPKAVEEWNSTMQRGLNESLLRQASPLSYYGMKLGQKLAPAVNSILDHTTNLAYQGKTLREPTVSIYDAFKINSPEDLYLKVNEANTEKQLKDILAAITGQLTATQTGAVRGLASSKVNKDFWYRKASSNAPTN